MSDRAALLAAIISDPADDTVRLGYADWLEEHGEPGRAEFIRVQVELATFPESEEEFAKLEGDARRRFHHLRDREWELLNPNWSRWVGAAAEIIPYGAHLDSHIVFHRGFAESVACAAGEWLAHAECLHWHPSQGRPCPETAHPIRRVTLTTAPEVDWFRQSQIRDDPNAPVVTDWKFVGCETTFTTTKLRGVSRALGGDGRIPGEELLSLSFPGVEFTVPDTRTDFQRMVGGIIEDVVVPFTGASNPDALFPIGPAEAAADMPREGWTIEFRRDDFEATDAYDNRRRTLGGVTSADLRISTGRAVIGAEPGLQFGPVTAHDRYGNEYAVDRAILMEPPEYTAHRYGITASYHARASGEVAPLPAVPASPEEPGDPDGGGGTVNAHTVRTTFRVPNPRPMFRATGD